MDSHMIDIPILKGRNRKEERDHRVYVSLKYEANYMRS